MATIAFLAVKYSMYAGAIFRPRIATITMTMAVTRIPIRVMPRWFFMNPPSLECSEAPRLAEIEPDEKRLPDDILVRYETPYSAVRRVVAVVPHHEIVPGGHGAGHTFAIVVAIFAKRERSREGDRRWRIALEEDGVLDPVQRLDELCRVVDPLAIEIVGNLLARLRDAVDEEFLVLVDDLVAGNADHALDVIERRILRKAKHHHIAALGLPDIDDLPVDERYPDAVGELVDQDEVPDHQRRHHRARGNLEGLDQERAQQENDEDDRKETLRIFDPPGFLVVVAALFGEIDCVGQRKRPRNDKQHEEYQREIHLLSTCSMARNASWGISTVPTCFMRFFPAFCFSSNFLLRLTSPP